VSPSEGWEERAAEWLAWARTPDFDAYWLYRDAFFALVPAPAGRTLEVGCGEGRVTRDLVARGHRVTALDASPTLLRAAAERDPDGEYVLGDAEALPLDDGVFDLVVAYNVLTDVADMPATVAEAARVLAPGGRFCACVTHPLQTAGDWEDGLEAPDAPDGPGAPRFVIDRSYLDSAPFALTMEERGLPMTFDGMVHPLEAYTVALETAGLAIEALREPRPGPAADARPGWHRWRRIPMFLMFRAVRVPG
jgi:SAM-dependent methyltransferase